LSTKKILTLEIFRAGPPHKLESLRACCLAQPRKAWGELNLTLTTDQSRASAGSVSILVLSCFRYLIFQAT